MSHMQSFLFCVLFCCCSFNWENFNEFRFFLKHQISDYPQKSTSENVKKKRYKGIINMTIGFRFPASFQEFYCTALAI